MNVQPRTEPTGVLKYEHPSRLISINTAFYMSTTCIYFLHTPHGCRMHFSHLDRANPCSVQCSLAPPSWCSFHLKRSMLKRRRIRLERHASFSHSRLLPDQKLSSGRSSLSSSVLSHEWCLCCQATQQRHFSHLSPKPARCRLTPSSAMAEEVTGSWYCCFGQEQLQAPEKKTCNACSLCRQILDPKKRQDRLAIVCRRPSHLFCNDRMLDLSTMREYIRPETS